MIRPNPKTISGLDELPPLPERVIAKDRQILLTEGDFWSLRAKADGGALLRIDFRGLRELTTPRFIQICKLFVASVARRYAAHSLRNIVAAIRRSVIYWHQDFGRGDFSWGDVSLPICQKLLAHGLSSRTGVGGNDFSHIRALYVWGRHSAALSDFDPHVALALSAIRAPGNLKGQRVRSGNPLQGPLIPEELALVHRAIVEGRGNPTDLVMAQLFAELCPRSLQLLRIRGATLCRFDVNILEGARSRTVTRFTLKIPRGKSQEERPTYRIRPVSNLLGERFEALSKDYALDAPLFHWLRDYAGNREVNQSLQRWARSAGLVSPRTGEILRLTSSRFRYTNALEAVRDGASLSQVADLLDHEDLQNVQVYFDSAGTVMDHIESQLDKAFGNQIQHFLGAVVDSTSSDLSGAVIPGVFPQLTEVPLFSLGIGVCGKDARSEGVCKLSPPISCYTCPKFGAFRDAPHKKIYESLESIAKSQFNETAAARIGGELVPTLLAIKDLIAQIQGTP